MIVDDQPYIRNLLRTILEMDGYVVVAEASDGMEAVTSFREHRPDVIIMDVEMPQKNGIEAAGDILSIDRETKILFCSSLGEDTLEQLTSSAGANGFIRKPFKDEDISESVRSLYCGWYKKVNS